MTNREQFALHVETGAPTEGGQLEWTAPIYDQRRLEAEAATNVLNEAKLTLLF